MCQWKELAEIHHNIKSRFDYVSDIAKYSKSEHWQELDEDYLYSGQIEGDCVAGYEEIFTDEGIKSINDLTVGSMVLSYDFENHQFCYRSIISIVEKGVMPLKRVFIKNGTYIDVTEDHPFWVSYSQSKRVFKKQYLKDIDLTRWWKRRIPFAYDIPYISIDNNWLNEEICFIIGHYIAEGWAEKSHVCTCGYDVHEHIIPKLISNGIPFGEGKNGNGVPIIRFKESKLKHYLKTIKDSSFDIHIPKELLRLPKNKLKCIVDGYFLGDGHNGNYQHAYDYITNRANCYSTSSEKWAHDLQQILLQLGIPCHIYKQVNHQGVGNKPIWRMSYNPKAHFVKEKYYKNISDVGIKKVIDIEASNVRDFTVDGTHTFIFKNGIIGHNCDDFALACRQLCREKNIPSRLVVCQTEKGGYHLVTEVQGWILDNRQNGVVSRDDLDYKWLKISGYEKGESWHSINN